MKVHIGIDANSGLTHGLRTTPANEYDLNLVGHLHHDKREFVFADAWITGSRKP